MLHRLAATTAITLAATATAYGDAQTWNFDVATTGQDVFWTSPTNVDPDAPQYHGAWVLQLIEVGIAYQGIPMGTIDVTDEVPPEDREGEDIVYGPAPILLLDDQITYPAPPEDPAIQATVRVELDAAGLGKVSIIDVTLGTVTVDLGWPFGEQDVQITSIRVAGTLIIEPQWPEVLGDLNGDGVVDVSDLLILLSAWGACPTGGTPVPPCPADLNGDGAVDVSDLLLLLANWG